MSQDMKKIDIIDTTLNPINYPRTFKKIYENNLLKKTKNFSKWIGIISKDNCNNIDWWVLNHVSRDPSKSKLFHNYCLLESLNFFFKGVGKKYKKIIVNKFIYEQLSKKYYPKKINKKLDIYESKENYNKNSNLVKFFISSLIVFIFVKLFKKSRKFNEPLILIDTFITKSNLIKGNIYGKKFISIVNKKKNIFFVPTLSYIKLFNLHNVLKELIKNSKYILKEEFISFSDLISSFLIFFRAKKLKSTFPPLNGWNLSELVNHEIMSVNSCESIIGGLINYKFARKMWEKKIKLKKVVNWFENQNLDKGWNFGFRTFFNKCEVLGYQGFIDFPEFTHLNPTDYELDAKVVPKKVIVIGNAYKKKRKSLCSRLNVIVGPALRFETNYSKKLKRKKYNILFVLSGAREYDQILLNKAIYIAKQNLKTKVFLKSHPIFPASNLKNIENIPSNVVEIFGDLKKIFQETANVIGAGPTSAILESLIYNCNLIIFKVSIYDKILMTSLNLPKNLYKIFSEELELARYLKNFIQKQQQPKGLHYKKIQLIKKSLFEPQNRKNLNLFL